MKKVIRFVFLVLNILNFKFILCPIFGKNGYRETIQKFKNAENNALKLVYGEKKDYESAKESIISVKKYLKKLENIPTELKISHPAIYFFKNKDVFGPALGTFTEVNRDAALINFKKEYEDWQSSLKNLELEVSKLEITFVGGGVLPFARAPDGKIYLLFSREAFGKSAGKWSDFGGKADKTDKNNAAKISAREFTEESIEMFGTLEETYKKLSLNGPDVIKIIDDDTKYVMFLVMYGYDPEINKKFITKRKKWSLAKRKLINLEKDMLVWVPIDKLISLLEPAKVAKLIIKDIILPDGNTINIELRGIAYKFLKNHLSDLKKLK